MWDYESWDVLSTRLLRVSHEAGALTALRIAYNIRALVHLFAGDFTDAASVVAEAESVTVAMGSSIAPDMAPALAALRGREAEAAVLIQLGTKDVQRWGESEGLSFVQWAIAVLCNGLGRYGQAHGHVMLRKTRRPVHKGPSSIWLHRRHYLPTRRDARIRALAAASPRLRQGHRLAICAGEGGHRAADLAERGEAVAGGCASCQVPLGVRPADTHSSGTVSD